MTGVTYVRYEVVRSFRNRRFLILSLAFPLVLYLVIAGSNRHHTFDSIPFTLYFMTGMAALGTMAAVIASGAVIAAERAIGWTRQMRVTPLTARTYLRAKVLCGYLRAILTIVLLGLAGTALGVRLSGGEWLTMLGLMLVALIPFALLGVLLGHLLSSDSVSVAVGGITTVFALLGGAYAFQLATSGGLFDFMKALPSYWLVQAGKAALGGGGWPVEGWVVIAAWTVALLPLVVLAYRRDTRRA